MGGRAGTARIAIAALLASGGLAADDWPGHLGPGRDGRSAETGLLRAWPEAGPPELWRVPIGPGYSSVAIVDGRLYTMFAGAGREWLAAFDAADGRELWRVAVGRERFDAEGSGPRATPSVDGGIVYGLGAAADLVAVDAASGAERWRHDLAGAFGARVPRWGVAGSPLVERGLLLVHGGGRNRAFLAFDAASGALRWSSGSALPAYAAPIAATVAGVRQAIFFGARGLTGVAVDDGRELWTAPWRTRYDVNAATPLFVPDSGLFVSSGYDTGAALLQLRLEDDGFEVYELWRSRGMRNHYSTSVRVDRHLYGYDEGILRCVEALTGDEAWRARAGSKGSLIAADGQLIVLGGQGELLLVEATPEAFREGGRVRISRDRSWSPPALANGVLYVRTWKELIALRVASSGR